MRVVEVDRARDRAVTEKHIYLLPAKSGPTTASMELNLGVIA